MADFTIPFGSVTGDNRVPTIDEKQNGFPCGPLDRSLFNKLIGRLEAELGSIADAAGIPGDDTDDTIILQAILALIAAATGGGATADYLLMSQARARLPIFPFVDSADGTFGVTAPATGTIRIPGSVTFYHRGIFAVTTAQTDFATVASKTYHLRWNPTDGFTLQDLASLVYNPTAAAETNSAFDSSYDDMLIARIVTNSSNIATITNLANLVRLVLQTDGTKNMPEALAWTALADTAVTLNWARTPIVADVAMRAFRSKTGDPTGSATADNFGIVRHAGFRLASQPTRYGSANLEYYYEDTKTGTSTANGSGSYTITAMAV